MIGSKSVTGNSVTGVSWASTFNKIAEGYDSLYVEEIHKLEDAVVFADMARRGLYRCVNILDLGSGTGLFLEGETEVHPARYHGIDFSEGMVDRARKKHSEHHFQVVDMREYAETLIDRGAKVDGLVSMYGAMSYVDLESVTEMVENLVAPEGRFYIMLYGPGRKYDAIYEASGRVGPTLPTWKDVTASFHTLVATHEWELTVRGLGHVDGQPDWVHPADSIFIVISGTHRAIEGVNYGS